MCKLFYSNKYRDAFIDVHSFCCVIVLFYILHEEIIKFFKEISMIRFKVEFI